MRAQRETKRKRNKSRQGGEYASHYAVVFWFTSVSCARNNLAAFFDVFAGGKQSPEIVESLGMEISGKCMPKEACSWNNTKIKS